MNQLRLARQRLTDWLLPPALDSRHRTSRTRGRLYLMLLALGLLFLALAITLMLGGGDPRLITLQIALVAAGAVLVGALGRTVSHDLLDPLTHLHHWAKRMREGDLSTRLPRHDHAEFGPLARDINDLSEMLQQLTTRMDDEVRRQTWRCAQKTRTLEVLYDVAASVNASRNLDELLTHFLHTLREVTNARAATVRLVTDDGSAMRLVGSVGLSDEAIERERIAPIARCMCGKTLGDGVIRRQAVSQCSPNVGGPIFPGDTRAEVIAVPLHYQGRQLGVYNLFVSCDQKAEREDLHPLLSSIGHHLGMAIEKARLDEETRRLNIMQERAMLAHELHDSLAQTLATLRFQIRMLEETQNNDGEVARSDVLKIRQNLDTAYTELRELVAHFRAPIHPHGLLPAIEEIVNEYRKSSPMHILVQKQWQAAALPPEKETQVLRIIQESLSNARKHANARNVRILMRCNEAGEYCVLVEDDGEGIGDESGSRRGGPGEHVGLSIMRERAALLGGELRIESEPGEGTRVELHFIHRPEAAASLARDAA